MSVQLNKRWLTIYGYINIKYKDIKYQVWIFYVYKHELVTEVIMSTEIKGITFYTDDLVETASHGCKTFNVNQDYKELF